MGTKFQNVGFFQQKCILNVWASFIIAKQKAIGREYKVSERWACYVFVELRWACYVFVPTKQFTLLQPETSVDPLDVSRHLVNTITLEQTR